MLVGLLAPATIAQADESLFGYVKGAETLPKGTSSLVQQLTLRSDKGSGHYQALDSKTEFEYGMSSRATGSIYVNAMAIDTHGLVIDGYLPKDEEYGLRASGFEAALKYNYLSPAKDLIGLSTYHSLSYAWRDPHSGQDKDALKLEMMLLLQKYFLDDQLVWAGNIGMEATHAKRAPIEGLPADFDWPTDPEMEIGFSLSMGLSYRVAPNWFVGIEAYYEEEHETEVGLERWSVQAGPSVHYGGRKWWSTLTWLPQLKGGGEKYPGQPDTSLHLIEKTEQELRLKIGYNF